MCRSRLGFLATKCTEVGLINPIIGGETIDGLEPLPTRNPAKSLGLVRTALRSEIIIPLGPNPTPRFGEGRWLERQHDLPPISKSQFLKIETRIIQALHDYAKKIGSDGDLSQDFTDGVGYTYCSDVLTFAALRIKRPFIAAVWNGPDEYNQALQHFEDNPNVLPSFVRDAFGLRPRNPIVKLEEYVKNLEYCRDILLPKLCHAYALDVSLLATIAPSTLRNACWTHPNDPKTFIEEWFKQSERNVRLAEDLGSTKPVAFTPSLSPLRSQASTDFLTKLPEVRSIATAVSPEADLTSIENLHHIRTAYRERLFYVASRLYSGGQSLLDALHVATSNRQDYDGLDLKKAAAFIYGASQGFKKIEGQPPFPDDLPSLIQICCAYLDDVRAFQKVGFRQVPAHSVSRSHSPEDYKRVVEHAKLNGIPPWVTKGIYSMRPHAKTAIEDFINKRDGVDERIFELIGQRIEREVVSVLTYKQHSRGDGSIIAENFVVEFAALLKECCDEYVQSWMIADALARWPDDPHRKVRFFRSLARKGAFETSSDATLPHTKNLSLEGQLRYPDSSVDPQELYIQQEERTAKIELINNLLAMLNPEQRLAVAYVFTFPLPPEFDSNSLEDLCLKLKTDNLEEYVMALLEDLGKHG